MGYVRQRSLLYSRGNPYCFWFLDAWFGEADDLVLLVCGLSQILSCCRKMGNRTNSMKSSQNNTGLSHQEGSAFAKSDVALWYHAVELSPTDYGCIGFRLATLFCDNMAETSLIYPSAQTGVL